MGSSLIAGSFAICGVSLERWEEIPRRNRGNRMHRDRAGLLLLLDGESDFPEMATLFHKGECFTRL